MAGTEEEASQVGADLSLGSLDEETAGCLEKHLRRAVNAEDATEKDFHVRHARQLLQGVRE